jgi:hypothetical protein
VGGASGEKGLEGRMDSMMISEEEGEMIGEDGGGGEEAF